jgi:hypothetical protein
MALGDRLLSGRCMGSVKQNEGDRPERHRDKQREPKDAARPRVLDARVDLAHRALA